MELQGAGAACCERMLLSGIELSGIELRGIELRGMELSGLEPSEPPAFWIAWTRSYTWLLGLSPYAPPHWKPVPKVARKAHQSANPSGSAMLLSGMELSGVPAMPMLLRDAAQRDGAQRILLKVSSWRVMEPSGVRR
jgi:hypothetical protein